MKAARMMGIAGLVALLVAWGVPTQAVTTTTVNFDAVDASGGWVAGSLRDDYLALYGITLSDITPGTGVYIYNQGENLWLNTSSPPNVLIQAGPQMPVSYRMNFASPLEELGFTRVGLNGDAYYPPGIAFPEWWVSIYNSSGVLLASAHENPFSTWSDVPPATFTLQGPDIAYAVVATDNHHFAGFVGVSLDDFVLTEPDKPIPEPVTMATVGMCIAGLGGYIRRRMAK